MSKRPKYHLFQSIFFILLLVTAAYVLARSSVFEVRQIKVVGNYTLTSENITAASGINPGENIFKLDLKASAQRLQIIPLIKKAELTRKLPAAVEIQIEERRPRAILPFDGGFIQVDEEGVCLQKGNLGQSPLPVITGVNFTVPAPGGQIKSQALDKALTVAKGLPGGLLPMLSEIHVEGDLIIIYTLDGIQCRLGTASDAQQKGEVLMKVLTELKEKGKKIQYIDLSYTGSPVVKYGE